MESQLCFLTGTDITSKVQRPPTRAQRGGGVASGLPCSAGPQSSPSIWRSSRWWTSITMSLTWETLIRPCEKYKMRRVKNHRWFFADLRVRSEKNFVRLKKSVPGFLCVLYVPLIWNIYYYLGDVHFNWVPFCMVCITGVKPTIHMSVGIVGY